MFTTSLDNMKTDCGAISEKKPRYTTDERKHRCHAKPHTETI